ncbi:MAG: amidohydrolase family protein [Bryobacteraceae bacterium]|nr:amidohydrolase family protein [Bryobacteraceae bacterium]
MRAILLFLLATVTAWSEVPSGMAIRNARVVTVSGAVLPKATVLIRDGLIENVGPDLPVPADAWLIEGEGLTVYPGLVDALSTLGQDARPSGPPAAAAAPAAPARGPEDRPRTFSWERIADKVRAADPRVETARGLGFTSTMTFPVSGIFAGQGAVMNLGDARPSRLIVQSPAGQYLSFALGGGGGGGRGFPSSLMGVIAYVRQCYLDLDYYKQAKAAYDRDPKGRTRPEYDRALEGLAESPRLLFPAVGLSEIDRILRFAKELKQPAVLYGLHEGFRAADLLKTAGYPVIVSTKWPTRQADADPDLVETTRALETRAKAPSTPGVLAAQGIKFAFSSDGQSAADMLRGVRKAMQMGLSEADALRALTLSPAEIFGVADRMGSIEKGKIANLVVTRGDLLSERPRIEYIIVDGVKYLPPVPPATPAAKEMTR